MAPDFNQSSQSVARYKDLISKGFQVKAIEMGNENFYPGQRSSIIPNAKEYLARAKNMSQSLKALDPTIEMSIPMLRRGSVVNPTWNADLTKDLSYFDAITVHTYIGANPDDPKTGDASYGTALTARSSLESSTNNFARPTAPNKPVWLSEWGVSSGGPNAASILGMADCYLFMAENQNIYQRANWYSVNGKLNSFYVWENYTDANGNTKSSLKIPYTKTAYASTFEILRSVFENSTMLGSTMTTSTIGTVKAVSGRAVTKNGATTVFLTNLTSKPVNFTLKFDDVAYNNSFKHETMKFTSLDQFRELPLNTNPLTLEKQGTGQITLPPLSINVISNLTIQQPSTGGAGGMSSGGASGTSGGGAFSAGAGSANAGGTSAGGASSAGAPEFGGATSTPGAGGSLSAAGSVSTAGSGTPATTPDSSSGCSCRTAQRNRSGAGLAGVLFASALAGVGLRRTRARSRVRQGGQ